MRVRQALAHIVLQFLAWEIAHASLSHTPGWPLHAQPSALDDGAYALVYVLAAIYVATLLTSGRRQPLCDRPRAAA